MADISVKCDNCEVTVKVGSPPVPAAAPPPAPKPVAASTGSTTAAAVKIAPRNTPPLRPGGPAAEAGTAAPPVVVPTKPPEVAVKPDAKPEVKPDKPEIKPDTKPAPVSPSTVAAGLFFTGRAMAGVAPSDKPEGGGDLTFAGGYTFKNGMAMTLAARLAKENDGLYAASGGIGIGGTIKRGGVNLNLNGSLAGGARVQLETQTADGGGVSITGVSVKEGEVKADLSLTANFPKLPKLRLGLYADATLKTGSVTFDGNLGLTAAYKVRDNLALSLLAGAQFTSDPNRQTVLPILRFGPMW